MNITTRVLGSFAALLVAMSAAGCAADPDDGQDLAQRQEEVAERGAEVMPFDLEATTHVFEQTPDGVIQRVTVDREGDDAQIALVREHLAEEVERFRAGDYGDPTTIHGDDMPGVAELSASAGDIEIAYSEISDGASLTFTSRDGSLIQSLHDWADAQVTDHGSHASNG